MLDLLQDSNKIKKLKEEKTLGSYLQLGNWRTWLFPRSDIDNDLVNETNCYLGSFLVENNLPDERYNFTLIGHYSSNLNTIPPSWLPIRDQQLWDELNEAIRNLDFQSLQGNPAAFWWPQKVNGVEPISDLEPYSDKLSAIIVRNNNEYASLQAFLFLIFLANRWHVLRGGVCIHSAAVESRDKGFLFLGESTAGKTTVSLLSSSIDCKVLGDDLNVITYDQDRGYRLSAMPSAAGSPVGYSMDRPPLRGVFVLRKDQRDYLAPIGSKKLAQYLFEGVGQTPKASRLPSHELRLSFETCCRIARSVPGYELHFRKSPDFWKLIDAEFPD